MESKGPPLRLPVELSMNFAKGTWVCRECGICGADLNEGLPHLYSHRKQAQDKNAQAPNEETICLKDFKK